MKILLTGRTGQVGSQLATLLPRLGEMVAPGRDSLDLADENSIRAAVRRLRPDVIVNAAAYNEVDRTESDPAPARAVNALAPGVLAQEARAIDALLVHYSSDYVFDGTKSTSYLESDEPRPLNEYGRSKLAGERAVIASGARALVLRVAWVYSGSRRNFATTMLRLAREREELRVVADQIGCPTSASAIATATVALLSNVHRARAACGVYHMAAAAPVSRFDFVQRLLELTHSERARPPRLLPITTAEYPLPAARPLRTALDPSSLHATFAIVLPTWQAQLERCVAELHAGGASGAQRVGS